MPPLPRPPPAHAQSGLPYTRPPSSGPSAGRFHKKKPDRPLPEEPAAVVAKLDTGDTSERRKKKKKRSRSRSAADTLDGVDLSTSGTAVAANPPNSSPKVENQEDILGRYMTMSTPAPAPAKGILMPKKAEQSTLPKATLPKVSVKKVDLKLQTLQKKLVKAKEDAERLAVEMKEKIEVLEKEVETRKVEAEQKDQVSPSGECVLIGTGHPGGTKVEGLVERGGTVRDMF